MVIGLKLDDNGRVKSNYTKDNPNDQYTKVEVTVDNITYITNDNKDRKCNVTRGALLLYFYTKSNRLIKFEIIVDDNDNIKAIIPINRNPKSISKYSKSVIDDLLGNPVVYSNDIKKRLLYYDSVDIYSNDNNSNLILLYNIVKQCNKKVDILADIANVSENIDNMLNELYSKYDDVPKSKYKDCGKLELHKYLFDHKDIPLCNKLIIEISKIQTLEDNLEDLDDEDDSEDDGFDDY